jgi:hypothetical protein
MIPKQSSRKKLSNYDDINMYKITDKNVNDLRLDLKLSTLDGNSPFFEGMPVLRFSETPIDWKYITKEILSHYPAKLPFK